MLKFGNCISPRLSTAWVFAMALAALVTAPVHAQQVPQPAPQAPQPAAPQPVAGEDLFDDFDNGGGNAGAAALAIDSFTLAGNGCPDRASAMVTLAQPRRDSASLRIAFQQADRPLQVSGPGAQTANCTVRVQLRPGAQRPRAVSLTQVTEGVRFANRRPEGAVILRSQFQINDEVSTIREVRLNSTPETAMNNLLLGGFTVRSAITRAVEVRAILQLQLQGQNDAVLRVDSVNIDLGIEPAAANARGAAAADPFVRRR